VTVDISEPLRRAHANRSSWTRERAREAMAQGLVYDSGRELRWEEADGERWAQILDPEGVAALVRADLPIVFLFRDDADYASWLEERGVVVVRGSSFSEPEFSVDPDVLWEAFWRIRERGGVDDDDMDIAAFPMQDLWFMTI
jgi:aspartate/methionine/tyrosine aminotransferase